MHLLDFLMGSQDETLILDQKSSLHRQSCALSGILMIFRLSFVAKLFYKHDIGLGQFSTVLSCTSCGCRWFVPSQLGKLQLPEIAMFYCCLQKLRISKVEEKEAQAGHDGKRNSSEELNKKNREIAWVCLLFWLGPWHWNCSLTSSRQLQHCVFLCWDVVRTEALQMSNSKHACWEQELESFRKDYCGALVLSHL